ncbi:peptidylprolyl isomerase [Dielma fastidiosa]|uniref:Foldase protein PrsA n=1 Tax=Dielma fastidiosa TaxID=1034346 RepID=A0A318KRX9_9FIRM|nr:peptidylprolyl isomerase [Dielma fastidiosa]PXX80480.1 foldase protein PrsA [Dielma fastidiosa]RHM99512.1 foldase [Dielma fastidiosa]
MIDKLKENWFVVLVAVLLFTACGYFVYDMNKDKLPGKKADGKDVVAELAGTNIFADDLYDDLYGAVDSESSLGTSMLYMYFERAVADEAVPMTSELKSQISAQVSGVRQNYQAYYGDQWETYLLQGLQASGYTSIDDLEAYFTHYLKLQTLKHENYDANLDSLFSKIHEEKKSRTVSHILVKMTDPDNPTEEEQKKMDDIDAALASGTDFAEVAKQYSDDSTASAGGALGYVDSDTSFVTAFKEAALSQEKGTVGDWVQTEYGRHKILVTETDKAALEADESIRESLYTAIDSYYPEMGAKIVWDKAQELNVTFSDPKIEEALKAYMNITE